MTNLIWLSLSVFLIFIIFLRSPQNGGLASFATKSNLLGSPSSAERFLNNLTVILIILYLIIAIQFNFNNL
jgi:protein translocase SecG subunit|tara:strand:+ start:7622 stop:7834 length:213 start_codon:yes stop_codon:yes gene_type:complete